MDSNLAQWNKTLKNSRVLKMFVFNFPEKYNRVGRMQLFLFVIFKLAKWPLNLNSTKNSIGKYGRCELGGELKNWRFYFKGSELFIVKCGTRIKLKRVELFTKTPKQELLKLKEKLSLKLWTQRHIKMYRNFADPEINTKLCPMMIKIEKMQSFESRALNISMIQSK